MPQFDDARAHAQITDLHTREEEKLVELLAPKYGLKYANLRNLIIDAGVLKLVPEDIARAAEVAAFFEERGVVRVAVRNPKNPLVEKALESIHSHGKTTDLYLATPGSIAHAWERYQDMDQTSANRRGVLDIDPELIKEFATSIHSYLDIGGKISEIMAEHDPHQTSKVIAVIFGGALSLDASDIHIEPEANAVRVRYRLDGVLWDICNLDTRIAKHIVSRLKLLAGVKLNIHKQAQDGRFTFDISTREVEVRTSIIPGAYGESLVMRLLDPSAASFKIENLGMSGRIHEVIMEELKRPNGAIITSGPTGSGKTTTLYSFLMSIHTPTIKIITLEDPVEYKLPGIVQTQVTGDYSFEKGLRTILRQDPDVILLGEIRDHEVAETTIHAALTGHLVFSTLHTNSAISAIPRLVDMGVDPRMIGSACNIFLGQRLVRKLCESCKTEREMTVEEKKIVQRVLEQPVDIHTLFEGTGCEACGGSGYKGRIGVFEALQIDTKVAEAIVIDTSHTNIKEAAKHQNIPTMQQDGILKVLAGITSIDEISRVLDLQHLD